MAYLIFFADNAELDRREIQDQAVIGRSPECAISIRDINLSRRHCQVTSTPTGWIVEDLQSKNGTFVGGRRIERENLVDGQLIQIGKTRVIFRSGAFVCAAKQLKPQRPAEPVVDPLAGTVTGFVLDEPAAPVTNQIRLPRPQPRPSEPAAYEREQVYSMVAELVSSSWDSIYASASRPVKPAHLLPRPIIRAIDARTIRPRRPEFPMVLQATEVPIPEAPQRDTMALPPVLPQLPLCVRRALRRIAEHLHDSACRIIKLRSVRRPSPAQSTIKIQLEEADPIRKAA